MNTQAGSLDTKQYRRETEKLPAGKAAYRITSINPIYAKWNIEYNFFLNTLLFKKYTWYSWVSLLPNIISLKIKFLKNMEIPKKYT